MDEMQEMLEHYRITKLIKEYCHGCDRGDGERMGGVYARDSWDDHGSFKMPGREFAAAIMANRQQRKDVMSHQLGQSLVRVDGDEAGAETYFVATVVVDDPEGKAILHQLGGRYVDELTREEGRWKIKKRLTVRDWSTTQRVEKDYMGTLGFTPGRTDGADPSFSVLGIEHSGASTWS